MRKPKTNRELAAAHFRKASGKPKIVGKFLLSKKHAKNHNK